MKGYYWTGSVWSSLNGYRVTGNPPVSLQSEKLSVKLITCSFSMFSQHWLVW